MGGRVLLTSLGHVARLPAFLASKYATPLLGMTWGTSGSNGHPFNPSGWTWSVVDTGFSAGRVGGGGFAEHLGVLRYNAVRHCNDGGWERGRLTVGVGGRKPGVICFHIGRAARDGT